MGDAYSLSGSQTFTWLTTSSSNVEPNTIQIQDVTNASILGSGLANDGNESLNIGTITFDPATPGPVSQQWSIQGTNTQAGIFNRTRTVSTSFVYPLFVGIINNGDIVDGGTYSRATIQ